MSKNVTAWGQQFAKSRDFKFHDFCSLKPSSGIFHQILLTLGFVNESTLVGKAQHLLL